MGKNGMENTINKHARVDEERWRRTEKAAHERGDITPVRLMISVAFEAAEGCEWLRTEAKNLFIAFSNVRHAGFLQGVNFHILTHM